MSCQTCHVNPAGGGIRNGPGRYYARSTLPVFGAHKRPTHDSGKRDIVTWIKWLFSRVTTDAGTADAMVEATAKKHVAEDRADSLLNRDRLSLGHPAGTQHGTNPTVYSFKQEHYEGVNADPFFTFGGDMRLAMYATDDMGFLFPMQSDIGAALHPVEHITLSGTVGLQGRTNGFKKTFNDPVANLLQIRSAFLLIHELPFMSYAQVGMFLPEFGIRMDDHTLYSRWYNESDHSLPENIVQGIQVGMAPNYPYFSGAVFRVVNNNRMYSGWGFSCNAAFRGETWGAGISYLDKEREFINGGILRVGSLNGYVNAWQFFPRMRHRVPLTLEMEYDVALSDRTADQTRWSSTWLAQLDWLAFNGINLHLNHSFYDSDWQLAKDFIHRIGVGMDITPLRHIRISTEFRISVPYTGRASPDVISFVHVYW